MDSLIKTAKRVINIEKQAIADLENKLDNNFISACKLIKKCQGKVVLIGMGKSGHIARKIAATFASTGTPSFFIHPAEAGHGDLGTINTNDIVIAISYSGNNDEILILYPLIKRLGVPIISITGNSKSAIAQKADNHLDIGVSKEACPHNLAPTASTTAALVIGDALAISLLEDKGFSTDDFARTHPSGVLGRRLLTLVADVMQTEGGIPVVKPDLPLNEVLLVISSKRMGFVIASKNKQVLGVFTDGDLRRVLEKNLDFTKLTMQQVMRKNCKTICADKPAVLAAEMMDKYKINALPVIDRRQHLVGAVNTHHLLAAKII